MVFFVERNFFCCCWQVFTDFFFALKNFLTISIPPTPHFKRIGQKPHWPPPPLDFQCWPGYQSILVVLKLNLTAKCLPTGVQPLLWTWPAKSKHINTILKLQLQMMKCLPTTGVQPLLRTFVRWLSLSRSRLTLAHRRPQRSLSQRDGRFRSRGSYIQKMPNVIFQLIFYLIKNLTFCLEPNCWIEW
jgi:hypothetical protein